MSSCIDSSVCTVADLSCCLCHRHFESRSRLDGEKPEEDEIRTKEDGQDDVSVAVGVEQYIIHAS